MRRKEENPDSPAPIVAVQTNIAAPRVITDKVSFGNPPSSWIDSALRTLERNLS